MNAVHRIGLIVPSSNTTMETEVPSLLRGRERERPQDQFTFHSARLRMRHVTPEELRAMNAQTERATVELADMRPDVVATACLVAIMAQGPKHHCVVQAEIESILDREGAAAPVVSSAGALVDALHALGARRIGMVTPYLEELTRLVAGYIEDAGIEVGDAVSLGVSDNRAVAALDPEDLKTHWRRLDLRDCDALVLSACVQMPSLSAIEAVERASGLPTLSAATATAWAILRALDLDPVAPNAGELLRARVAGRPGGQNR
ncbi:MAG: maleate isomerase [Miltoncostaeaceae bacterium]|nr:maleate isomerase [Miltoncostaeaceae bacterium]